MKSVLIIDTPNNCKECPVGKCPAWVDADRRPNDCLLRPLPNPEIGNEYTFEGYENGKVAGFNRCLELIGGIS